MEKKYSFAEMGTALYEAVAAGKINTRDYHKGIDGINVIKKCIQ